MLPSKTLIATCELAGHSRRVEWRLGLALTRLHADVNTCFKAGVVEMVKRMQLNVKKVLCNVRPFPIPTGHVKVHVQTWKNMMFNFAGEETETKLIHCGVADYPH